MWNPLIGTILCAANPRCLVHVAYSSVNFALNFTAEKSTIDFERGTILKVVLFALFPAMIIVNATILLLLICDLLLVVKTHYVLQLGLVGNDIIFSGFGLMLTWYREEIDPHSTVCLIYVFAMRHSIMGSSIFVTLLAMDRYLMVAHPLWYGTRDNIKPAIVIFVVANAALFGIAGLSFIHNLRLGPTDRAETFYICSTIRRQTMGFDFVMVRNVFVALSYLFSRSLL